MNARRSFLAGAVCTGLATGFAPLAFAAARPKLKLGIYSKTIFFLPIWIALEKGFFVDAGLEVELEHVPTMAATAEAMLHGDAPIAMLGPEVAFLEHGKPDAVRVIGGNANRPPHFLIAQSRFKRLEDLRGARFGVISLSEGTTYLVQRMLAKAGLSPQDYVIEAVGSAPTRVKLLDEGKIDAALQPFPLSYEAEDKGFSNLGWVGTAEPDWQFSVVLANESWLKTHRAEAAAFMTGALRGRRFMSQNRAEAAEIASRYMAGRPTLSQRALDDAIRLDIMDENFRWSERGMHEIYRTMQGAGALPASRPFDITEYVDARPLNDALNATKARVGRR